ncbi:MAG: hypothetical protein WKF63_06415, partial [Thermomicrobiales bacterium]
APLVSLAGTGWLIRRRSRTKGNQAASTHEILTLGVAALVLVVLAVQTRSAPAVFAAAWLGTVAAWQATLLDRGRDHDRTIVTTPRPPGSRVAAMARKSAGT